MKVIIFAFLQIFLISTLFSDEIYKLEIVGLKNLDKNYVLTEILPAEVDPEKAKQILEASGWFSNIKLEKDESNKILKLYLTEYPVIKDAVIFGSTILDNNSILNFLGIKKGTVFNRAIFYSNINKLYEVYKNKGFTQTEIDHIEISTDGILNIYILEWGLKEIVIIKGFQNSKNRIINFLLSQNGPIYNANLFKKSIETLYYSGLFQNINLKIIRSKEKGHLIAYLDIEKASPELDLKIKYNSFKGIINELGFTIKGFMQSLDTFKFKFNGYKLSGEKYYSFESTLNNLLDLSRAVSLGMKIKYETFYDKLIEGYFTYLNLTHFSYAANITLPLCENLATQASLSIGSYKTNFMAGANHEHYYLEPSGRLLYQKFNRERRNNFSLNLGAELNKPVGGRSTFKGELSGQYEFYVNKVRNTFSFWSGLSKGNYLYIFNKFHIGANNKSRFLKYDSLFLDNYIIGSLNIQLPYLRHYLSPYFFTEYIYGTEKKLNHSYSIPVFGVGFNFAGLPLDMYIAWGKKSSAYSAVFGLSLNLF